MKKIIFLFILFMLSTNCTVWHSRNCFYYEKDGLYYDSVNDTPCTSLNKKIEKDRKKGY